MRNKITIVALSVITEIKGATLLYNTCQLLLLQADLQVGIQVTNQRFSLLMHVLGHFIHQNPIGQPNVIRYDNYNRILSGDAANQDLEGSYR